MSAENLIRELSEKGRTPKATILASMKETGKKAVGCFPIYLQEGQYGVGTSRGI